MGNHICLGTIQLDPLDGRISNQIIKQFIEIVDSTTDLGINTEDELHDILLTHVYLDNVNRKDLRKKTKKMKLETLLSSPDFLITAMRHCFGIHILVNYVPPRCCSSDERPATLCFINLIDTHHIMGDVNGQAWLDALCTSNEEVYKLLKYKMFPDYWDSIFHVICFSSKCQLSKDERYKLLETLTTEPYHILDRKRDDSNDLVFRNSHGIVNDIDHIYHDLPEGKFKKYLAMWCPELNNKSDEN